MHSIYRMNRKLILYIACSLDGYIAAKNDNIDFLNSVAIEGEDYGYGEFIDTVDTVIVGRKTYDKVLSMGYDFPHADKESYIITRTAKDSIGNIHFYNGSIKELVENLKSKPGKNIFCDGGAEIVNLLLKDKLFDELYISIIPCLLGSGTKLFNENNLESSLKLVNSSSFKSGLVQIHYTFEK